MVIDSSALIAILLDEPEQHRFDVCIQAAEARLISAATLLETAIVIECRKGEAGGRELDRLLSRGGFQIVPLTLEHAQIARIAYRKFGKGRHSAKLNFGDCLAYALAKATGEPLLCKGDEFSRTDILVVSAGPD